MDRILWQCISAFRAATIPMVACRLLAGYLVGRAVALHRATNSLDKYLKFIAAQADASIADVRSDGYRHRRRFGACNA
jgi:hypothetical protein